DRTASAVTVSWKASSGAASYQVEYQSANTSWTWKTETDYKTNTATSFVSTNLANPPNYKYRVRALNSGGASAWVEVNYPGTVARPPAPTGLKAVKRDNTSATVSWNASAGAASYEVEYQSANTSWAWKTETDYKTKTAVSFVSTNLAASGTYFYRVRAVNSGGSSAWVEVKYPTTVNPPPAPIGLKVTDRTASAVTVSWKASSGAASYQVEYQSAKTSWNWTTDSGYTTKTAVSFVSKNLTAAGTNIYRVRAVNSGGSSAWVQVASVPAAPQGCSQSTTVGTVATCIVKLFDQLWQMPTTRSEASDIQRLENLNRNAQNYDEMIGLLTKLMKLDHDMKAKIISNFR
ncbi:MAG: fibronectin type III domain-containing protein, partial [Micrococcales bacterium]|nr:fibronectin type III domain-containing protein [Micrococcales bacterium]